MSGSKIETNQQRLVYISDEHGQVNLF